VEIIAILRVLWRARIAVAVGAIAAIALAFYASRNETPTTGIASTRVILDTDRSQLLRANTPGAETLPWRAQWLADLMGGPKLKARIASGAGIPPAQLHVMEPRLNIPEVATALPRRALEAAAVVTEPFVVIVEYHDQLPTLTLEARAPGAAEAKRLAEAAAAALEAEGVPQGTHTLQAFTVERVTPVRARELPGDSPLMMAFGMAIAFFTFWCGCIALTPAIGRMRRAALRAKQAA
jgi:hypothetical protein